MEEETTQAVAAQCSLSADLVVESNALFSGDPAGDLGLGTAPSVGAGPDAQADPSDDSTKFIRWLALEVAVFGPADMATLDVLSRAADWEKHAFRGWLLQWVLADLQFPDPLPDDIKTLFGQRLANALLELPPAKFENQVPYLDIARYCSAKLLPAEDVVGAALRLSTSLATHSVTASRPWTGLPEELRAAVKNASSGVGACLFYDADVLVGLCKLEMASQAPFQDQNAWPGTTLQIAATAFCVRAGSPRVIKRALGLDGPPPDVGREWRETDRHVMRVLSRELGAREYFETQSQCVAALIWLDALHGAHDGVVEGTQSVDGPALVVCKHGFAPASDRGDGGDEDMLGLCAPLCSPLPLPVAPSASAIKAAQGELLSEFPWAGPVLETIFGQLLAATLLGASTLYFEPTLIVGQPGAGKSRLVRRLAEVLQLQKVDIPLGGNDDRKVLSGTSRGWASGRPGDILVTMAERRTASVAVILDELDKASEGRSVNGSVHSYLLALMEPETASAYRDNFLKAPCDLSAVIWLATANALSTIPSALKSRLRILHLAQPGPEHYRAIASGALEDLAKRWRIDPRAMPTVAELELPWEGLSSARDVRRAVEAGVTQYALRSGCVPTH